MSGKNPLFKSGKTIRLWWDFCQSRICAGFGKSPGFWPEPEPKSSTALNSSHCKNLTDWLIGFLLHKFSLVSTTELSRA